MGGTVNVLHVEDEADIVDLTRMYLERKEGDGFVIKPVGDASEGVERLSEDEFDCVVSDYDLPGMNGIEFLEKVREEYPDLPFILFTGKGSEEIASEAISAGVTDYLQKGGSEKYEILANRIQNYVERRRAQRERRRQIEAIETAQEGISILDEEGRFVNVNEAYADLYGYEPEEMVGKHWGLVYRDEDIRHVEEEILPEVEDRGSWKGETTGLRSDSSTFVEEHTLAVTDEGGLVCTVRDITDEKKRERRFEAIFNNTYTFVGLLETDGTLLEANQTALSFGGLERKDVVGERIWDTYWFQIDGARETAREAVEHARDGELFRDEVRVQGSNREVVIDFTVRPVTDEAGDVTLLVPEGRDITERKRYVRRLETLIDNLPGMVYRCRNEPGWSMENVRGEVEKVTGYSRSALEESEDIYGKEVIHPDDRDEVWEAVQEAVGEGDIFEITYRIVTRDGDTKWVFERGQGIGSSENGAVAIEGFIMNAERRD
ncbi:MAG: PAS domain S-box protein [Halobacteriales archaeon]|nr:PAS domain S-box protein [Halobacteriales archaeon]